jgi:hypothetical protein
MKLNVILAISAALAVCAPASAHHAFAQEFDAKRPVKLKGKITKVELINPHSWIHISVADEGGKETAWMIEGGSPNALFRRGINQGTLPLGTEIVVDGYGARDGSNRAVGSDLTFPDGKRLFMGSSSPDSPDAKRK